MKLKIILKIIIGVLAFILLFLLWALLSTEKASVGAEAEAAGLPTSDTFPAFVGALMDDCGGGRYSDAMKRVKVGQIVRVLGERLEGNNRHAYAAILCLETRMGSVSKHVSTAGALGIAQIMPATGAAEAERCLGGKIVPSDLMDNELSLHLGACHYAALIEQHGPEIAPFAYNGGGNAEAVKLAKMLVPGGAKETVAYAATHAVIMARYLRDKNGK